MSVLIVTAVVGAVAAVGTAYAANQQAKAQKKGIAAQQRQADIANARERRNLVSQGRVQRASIESQAATSGLTGSSSAVGSMESVQSRVSEGLSFLDQNQQLSAAASKANQQAADWSSRDSNWATLGSIASTTGAQFGSRNAAPAPTNSGSVGK